MSAPVIWILVPGIAAILLLFLRKWEQLVTLFGISFSLILAVIAWLDPIGDTFILGPLGMRIDETFFVLGRRFVLSSSDAPVLTLIYLGAAFWIGGALATRTGELFVPLGLGITALLTAVIAVEPFLYAALLIVLVTIISIPIISPPGEPVSRGALRYLVFQTLAMPFILLAGWILSGVDVGPVNPVLVLRGNILLALGFAFLLPVFPFHTWVPMLTEETHPYIAAFIFYILSLVITFFGIGFLERFAWLRTSIGLYELLRLTGMFMVLIGGLWAAFQKHLGRLLGYAVLMETGFALLIMSTGSNGSDLIFAIKLLFTSLLPRGLAFGIFALALATISNASSGDLSYPAIMGKGRTLPLSVAAMCLALFSLAGFPLLAGFPVRLALWQTLSGQSLPAAIAALLGCLGLLAGGLRALPVLLAGDDRLPWKFGEAWQERLMMVIGLAALLLAGLIPQWFLPALASMTNVFLNIQP